MADKHYGLNEEALLKQQADEEYQARLDKQKEHREALATQRNTDATVKASELQQNAQEADQILKEELKRSDEGPAGYETTFSMFMKLESRSQKLAHTLQGPFNVFASSIWRALLNAIKGGVDYTKDAVKNAMYSPEHADLVTGTFTYGLNMAKSSDPTKPDVLSLSPDSKTCFVKHESMVLTEGQHDDYAQYITEWLSGLGCSLEQVAGTEHDFVVKDAHGTELTQQTFSGLRDDNHRGFHAFLSTKMGDDLDLKEDTSPRP